MLPTTSSKSGLGLANVLLMSGAVAMAMVCGCANGTAAAAACVGKESGTVGRGGGVVAGKRREGRSSRMTGTIPIRRQSCHKVDCS